MSAITEHIVGLTGPRNVAYDQGRRNEKKARGAENFKKAHCNYFELKTGFIDGRTISHCTGHSGVFRII